jgi:hypothetical protein
MLECQSESRTFSGTDGVNIDVALLYTAVVTSCTAQALPATGPKEINALRLEGMVVST